MAEEDTLLYLEYVGDNQALALIHILAKLDILIEAAQAEGKLPSGDDYVDLLRRKTSKIMDIMIRNDPHAILTRELDVERRWHSPSELQ